ncbi:hypothetical protein [Actinomycetospora sp.]|uniref:hypothetical protein n=1 Tax=Actinomycetospora sp. TaxID=1872135 RepID=UPI002F4129D7
MSKFCDGCGRRVDVTSRCACGAGLDGPTVALAQRALTDAARRTTATPGSTVARIDLATRTSRRQSIATTVVMTVVLVGITGAVLAIGLAAASRNATAQHGGVSSSEISPTPVASDASEASAPSSSASADPASALEAQREADRGALTAADGSWVPQVSSKRVGLVADGITYDNDAIWRQFSTISSAHPDARLLWSGDWASFSQSGFWVTVIDEPSASAASANAWCDAQGFPADQCFAHRLLTTSAPGKNTVPRH